MYIKIQFIIITLFYLSIKDICKAHNNQKNKPQRIRTFTIIR